VARACVIVLDAVGAGELPDAGEFGDEGSDTLGNVARAVGGLDLPTMEALGLGNVEPLEGCAPQPGAPAIAGRLLERSKGKDTTTGHWELMGIVTPTAMPTYPYGFPDEVIDPFMNRTGRGVIGNKPASGTEIIQELGEEHQRTGKWIVYTSADSVFQIAAHEETVPLDELYAACKVAREILTGKHAVGRVIARPFQGHPGAYERTPNRHDYSLEPRRPNYLSLVRDAGHKVYGVGKIGDIFAHQDIDEEFSTKSNVEGIQKTEELLRTVDDGVIFTNLVETDSLWGHRNDPVNFHRCLQDFDRRLPDLLDALRPNDLLIITSDHGCDPTTPSTDHSREHALLLAYVEGRNAAGRIYEGGEFADVGATVNAWLGGKTAPRGVPGTPIVEATCVEGRRSRPGWTTRSSLPRNTPTTNAYAGGRRPSRARRLRSMREHRWSQPLSPHGRGGSWRSGAVGASSPNGSAATREPRSSPSTFLHAWSSWRASAVSRRASPTFRRFRSGTASSTLRSPPGCSTTCLTLIRRSRSLRAFCGRAAASSSRRTHGSTCSSSANSSAAGRRR
jgi:phosphopentomutase